MGTQLAKDAETSFPHGIDPQICEKCGGEREIIAVILQDDVIVKILDHVGLSSRLPVLKPARPQWARAPPPRPARKQAARSPLPAGDGFFVDPDYSEFDCIDELPEIVEKARNESTQVRQSKSLLELIEHFLRQDAVLVFGPAGGGEQR